MKNLKSAARLLGGALVAMASSVAMAVGTPAGTDITNTATATFDLPGGATGQTRSSTVTLEVLELINVNVTSQESGNVPTSAGDTDQVLTFVVTNTGNAVEDFVLSITQASNDDFDMSNVRLYEDTDGSGSYSSGDALLTSGNNSIGLNGNSTTDQSQTVFIVADTPNNGQAATDLSQLTLTALSETVDDHGSSVTPGQVLAGVGNGAADAVVGTSYTDDANGTLEIGTGSGSATVDITKSITAVSDPFGGSALVPGSVVTYQIVATVRNGNVDNLVISDEIPGNMDYTADSMTLDGASVSDATDTDSGRFDAGTGTSGTAYVELGTQSAGASFTVTLQAEIK